MKILRILLLSCLLPIGQPVLADAMAPVMINGQQLTVAQWRTLELQLGMQVLPGQYLVNAEGCWLNLTSGASGCVGSGDVHSRYGSGSRGSDGSWNHWSNAAGGGVGGTGDGCIYTTYGWSNC